MFIFFCSPLPFSWCIAGSMSKLPLNLISTTNQQKVTQPVKQQIPLKLASRLSSGAMSTTNVVSSAVAGGGGTQQMLPLKLSQDEKVRRTSTSGYQRLGSDSFSPPSGDTVRTGLPFNGALSYVDYCRHPPCRTRTVAPAPVQRWCRRRRQTRRPRPRWRGPPSAEARPAPRPPAHTLTPSCRTSSRCGVRSNSLRLTRK